MTLPLVAIVGRPNVGKSTLINRIALKRVAITHKTPGVTRDRKYVEVEWLDKNFILIDTGGFQFSDKEPLEDMVLEQAMLAIKEAEAVIFVVDGKEGLNPYDEDISIKLKKSGVKTYLAVNKIDTEAKNINVNEFYKLGFNNPYPISASHGLGINELFDKVVVDLPFNKTRTDELTSVAIVGRPNVGKSLLLNTLIGEKRAIVSDVAGTTRDTIDSIVSFNKKKWRFIDTAGIKRKKVKDIEYYSSVRTLEALDRADIAVVVMDASEAITEQDQHILDYAVSRGCAIIILLNKWDLVDEVQNKKLKRESERKLFFVEYAPILAISAKTARGVKKIFEQLNIVEAEYEKKIKTKELNNFIRKLDLDIFPSKQKIRIGYGAQLSTKPPKFVFFTSTSKFSINNFKHFMEGKLRRSFGFVGTPVKIILKRKMKDES